MMKKIALLLLLSMILSACGTKGEQADQDMDNNSVITETKEDDKDETVDSNLEEDSATDSEQPSQPQQSTQEPSTPQPTKPQPTTPTQTPSTSQNDQTTTQETPKVEQDVNVDQYWSYYEEVLGLVNQLRTEAGVAPLTLDRSLCKAAVVRANEMAEVCDLSHTRPNGQAFYTALNEFSISYSTCGENVAAGQKSPAEVVEDWKKSPDHYQNIIDSDFGKMGVGYSPSNDKYGTYWGQLFTN